MRKSIVAGNWKMNGVKDSLAEIKATSDYFKLEGGHIGCDVLICPPYTLLAAASQLAQEYIKIGAQDCHPFKSGPHTGDISAEMIGNAGARFVIVGHSERRIDHVESNMLVNAKAIAAHRARLTAILCVGEDEETREQGGALDFVANQLSESLPKDATAENTVIAYEPIWAIGTGRVPTQDDIMVMHKSIRGRLKELVGEQHARSIRILYGGSVNGANAAELLAPEDVDGALVGGASLTAEGFIAIINAAFKG